MSSIRLSLLIFFLALSAGALSVVSALAYENTRLALEDKRASTRHLLTTKHDDAVRAVREELDERLLRRAQTLAGMAQAQSGVRAPVELNPLGVLGAAQAPFGHLLVPTWMAEGVEGLMAHRFRRPHAFIKISYADEILPSREDYFQVFGETGHSLQRSESLGVQSLPLNPALREQLGLFDFRADDLEIAPGVKVRSVTLKAPVSRFRFHFGPKPKTPPHGWPLYSPPGHLGRDGGSGGGGRQPGLPADPFRGGIADRISPHVFITCAASTRETDAQVAELDRRLAADLANLEDQTQQALTALRQRLLGVALATFVLAVVGGMVLVPMGLRPLSRLGDALSRVSEKSFDLDLDRRNLPAELQPIVERLDQTLQSLRQAFAREKQAAADISHELRTPLAALLTTLEVALRRPRSAEEYRELLAECKTSGQQMNLLVERLLALARLDAGVDALHVQEVDVAHLTQECTNLVKPLAEAKGLRVGVHGQQPTSLRTDPAKLREVLVNLLHNAIEYNRPHGSIDVHFERHNGTLELEVRDTGIGIAPAARDHLFQRFWRADPSRQADTPHAGLGLSIVKGYVDLMGGGIAVESELGQGSTFRLTLPDHDHG
jgi:heavy metal sensor kinase